MNCYDCANTGTYRDAVASCVDCGAGVCIERREFGAEIGHTLLHRCQIRRKGARVGGGSARCYRV